MWQTYFKNCNVHLDSHCEMKHYCCKLLCVHVLCTPVQPLEHISTLIVGSLRYPQHLHLLLLFHVLQTTVAAVSILANQPLTNRAGHQFSSIVAEILLIMGSLLAVATVFIMDSNIYILQSEKGGLRRKTKLPTCM